MLQVICDSCNEVIDEYKNMEWSVTILQHIMHRDNQLCKKCWIKKEKNKFKLTKLLINKKLENKE